MPREEDANALHLISDILDKLIDSQQSNAEANTSLKKLVEDTVKELDDLNRHFSNGFRADIKQYLDVSLNNWFEETHQYLQKGFDDIEKTAGRDLLETINKLVSDVKVRFDDIEKTAGRDLLETINKLVSDVKVRFDDIEKTAGRDLLETINDIAKDVKDMAQDIKNIKETQHSWWHWMKHAGLIMVGFGTAIGATIKVVQWIQSG